MSTETNGTSGTSTATATVTWEEVGKTKFGDPEIVVTVAQPHPKAGFQLLLKSTASMDHLEGKRKKTRKVDYLIYAYPEQRERSGEWHGAIAATSVDDAADQIAGYVDWLWQREQVRERLETGALSEHLRRFNDGLWETNAIDYEQEWQGVLAEVARINLIMAEVQS